jgi:hypothetical protein
MKEFNLEKTVPIKLMLFNGPNSRIELKNFKISFSMVTQMEATEDDTMTAQFNQNISFSKVLYFLTEIFNESILFESEHKEDIFKYLSTCDNNLVVLPDLSEGTIVTALHRKLNSISHETTRVHHVKLCDTDLDLTYKYTCTTEDDEAFDGLPDIDDWIGPLSYWEQPWWARPDQLTWDHAAVNQEEWEQHKGRDLDGSEIDPCAAFDEIEAHLLVIFQEALIDAGLAEKKEGQLIEVDFEKKKPVHPEEKWVPTVI